MRRRKAFPNALLVHRNPERFINCGIGVSPAMSWNLVDAKY